MLGESTRSELKASIASYPDFPTPGIDFKDIAPVLADGQLFGDAVRGMCAALVDEAVAFDAVVAVSRGFFFGAPIASHLRGLIPVRKPGKLPGVVDAFEYTCEYATGVLEIHRDVIRPDGRYLVLERLARDRRHRLGGGRPRQGAGRGRRGLQLLRRALVPERERSAGRRARVVAAHVLR
jgi:adenine phosphoribosyltransferase